MRLIDADALEKLLIDMATDAKSIRELQLNALCYAAVKSENMTPTIAAIPVEWLIEHDDEDIRDSDGNSYGRRKITVVEALSMWQEEQEA